MQSLIFNETDGFVSFPVDPQIGMVGCYSSDRTPSWGYFIVKAVDNNDMQVITPAMRYINGRIELGKTSVSDAIKCVCYDRDDYHCRCGAGILNEKQWNDNFIACDTFETTWMRSSCDLKHIRLELAKKETLRPYYNFDPADVAWMLRGDFHKS
jgi:hypothetical protein